SIMHAAIHDALNTIDRRYSLFAAKPAAKSPDASPASAIAAAARGALANVVAGISDTALRAKAQALLDKTYSDAIAKVEDGDKKSAGIAVGEAAAKSVVAMRANDKADATVDYKPGAGPGKWRPHPNPSPANPP